MPSAKPVGCDSSVLIPALSQAHEFHELCRVQLPRVTVLPAHVLLETFSWLSGLRDGRAVPPRAVVRALEALDLPVVQLPPGEYLEMLGSMAWGGRSGAAVYDAQIAATAKHHGVRLLSRDRRAAATYELIGADYELI